MKRTRALEKFGIFSALVFLTATSGWAANCTAKSGEEEKNLDSVEASSQQANPVQPSSETAKDPEVNPPR
jgi:hypothetical protein